MKQKIIFIFFLILSAFRITDAFSQTNDNLSSFVPAVSQNLGITNGLTNVNADYYSGRLSYTSPLNNVNIYGINFPISLNYSTTGIKVQEVSGVTGLGWTSSLGGEITREIHGIPDDWYYGYCGTDRTGGRNYSTLNQDYIDKVSAGTWDSQPDKFYFSFLGFTGSFVMDPDGNPLLLSNQTGIKIDYCPFKRGQATAPSKWVLRDQKGNQYFFEIAQSTTNLVHQPQQNQYQTYQSAWYITKIITAANQEIDFAYTSGANIAYTDYLNIRRIDKQLNGPTTLFSCLGKKHTADTSYNQNVDISYQPYYLTGISGNGVNINLGYGSRLDFTTGKTLTDISVVYNNRATASYKLNYSYFTSDDGTGTKRLKLTSVNQVYPGNIMKTLFSFYYNETVNLPARNSFKTDYLGYYNANAQNSDLNGFADKTPNQTNAQANVLQKVKDIFGGSTNFEYELNYYRQSNTDIAGAGLRIKRIYQKKSDSDTEILNQTTFSYTLVGTTNSSGQVYSFYSPYSSSSFYVYCNDNSGATYYYSSEALDAFADGNSANVGYSQVTATKADGSSIRYTLTNYLDYPDKNVVYNTYSNNAIIFSNNDQSNLSSYSSKPRSSYLFARGKILKEDDLDSGGQPVKTVTYAYSLTAPSGLVVGITPAISSYNLGATYFDVTGYSYSTQDLRLDSKTTTYAKSGVNQQSVTESFVYTGYAANLIQNIISTGSSGRSDKVTFRYPFNVIPATPGSAPPITLPLTYMVYNNIIENPVEVIHSVIRNGQAKVVSANITKYGATDYNILAPSKELKSEFKYPVPESEYVTYSVAYNGNAEVETIDSRLKPYKLYTRYTPNNILAEEQTVTIPAAVNAYIYGYNGIYPTAVINNASISNVAYSSFESNDKGNWSYSGNPVFDLSSITGTKYYDLSKGAITNNSLSSATTYIITYWTKNLAAYAISGTQGTPALLASRNGWNCYQHIIKNISGVTVSGSGYIDELRLYPVGAKIATSTYEPLIGMTSKNDENNQITYYSYDEFNRLQYIKDNEKNILQAYCYNFNGEPGNCFTTVTNQSKSASFYKIDCGPGYGGSSVTYTVPAGRYIAGTQQAADGLAQIEIDQNGQGFANVNGTCSPQTVYARIEMSNFTGENTSGSGGESSSISRADIYIRLYTTADCSTPFAPHVPLPVVVAEGYSSSTPYNGSTSGSDNVTISIPANQSSFFMGNVVLSSYATYIDPYSGSGYVTESYDYTYDVTANGAYYTPASTISN
ncbi:DUF5977 domain-containing protein [Mucilaginibacter sp. OK283]|uniref:DUF5977 domain-containing protein n=1 Tax=Mucilaginibacter sp. OK283 TaxID=1881049 RepID=UPI0008D1208C|nr:DUF5977 domain-containing protein [Mucilaginibacter sp. OK283]SEO61466.1 hypothetical protein SAMN05428947_103134 [Mucilaginibacter sp. OK283]